MTAIGELARHVSRAITLHAAVLVLVAGGCARTPDVPRDPDPIAFFTAQVEADEHHWPGWAHLGLAHLERARGTHDAADLAAAREALERSLAIQPNYDALRGMAALASFRHRFHESLEWARRAAAAADDERALLPLRVEALLGLGRADEAGALVEDAAEGPPSFHAAAARGHWLEATERPREAAVAFVEAALLARERGSQEHELWAKVRAARAWVDAGDCEAARAHLRAAARLDPRDADLRAQQAAVEECEGRPAAALAILSELLEEIADPRLHARAAALARELGREASARRHFKAAEAGLQRALDGGDVHALGALVRLYRDTPAPSGKGGAEKAL